MVAAVEDKMKFYIRLTNGVEIRGTLPVSEYAKLLRRADDFSSKVDLIDGNDIAVVLVGGIDIYHVEAES